MFETHSRFLLVEGEGSIRRMLSRMLHGVGVKTVHNAPNGNDAKELLRGQAVDLILYDWDTPEVGGVEFLRNVRSFSLTKYLPFLLMSRNGQLEEADLAVAKDHDVDGHLFKPVTMEELRGTLQRAVDHYNSMVEVYTHLARAAALVDVGSFDEARDELRQAQEKAPDNPRVWAESGQILSQVNGGKEAKECFHKAIEVDQTYTGAYDHLAVILKKEGRHDLAARFLEISTQISPKNRERQFSFAEALLNSGDEDGARIAVHRAVEDIAPDSAKSAAAAEFFLAAGRADLAEEQYAFALESDPANVHYFNRLGIAMRRQKKFKEAVQNYRKALQVSSDDPVLYFNMAVAMAEGRDYPQAISALRRALVLDPSFSDAEKLMRKIEQLQNR